MRVAWKKKKRKKKKEIRGARWIGKLVEKNANCWIVVRCINQVCHGAICRGCSRRVSRDSCLSAHLSSPRTPRKMRVPNVGRVLSLCTTRRTPFIRCLYNEKFVFHPFFHDLKIFSNDPVANPYASSISIPYQKRSHVRLYQSTIGTLKFREKHEKCKFLTWDFVYAPHSILGSFFSGFMNFRSWELWYYIKKCMQPRNSCIWKR